MAPLPKEKVELNLSKRFYDIMRDKTPPKSYVKDDPFYKGREDNRILFHILSPFFRNPYADILEPTLSHQGTGMCGDVEKDMMNCLEAYGIPKAYEKCKYVVEDLCECNTQWKQTQRMIAMRNERRRQFNNGERKIKYAPPPKLGSFGVYY
ncbi:hypothetical protein PGB90_008837 [Kerria lacca]